MVIEFGLCKWVYHIVKVIKSCSDSSYTLLHSNAEEEHLFSMITNKFRPNLKLDGTLTSLVTIK